MIEIVLYGVVLGLAVLPGGIVVSMGIAILTFAAMAQIKGWGMSEAELRVRKFSEVLLGGAMGRSFHGSLKEREE